MPDRLSVRLIGINAPETKTAKCKAERDAGEAAKLYVSDRLARATEVKVEFIKWDKYGGRFDGKVTVDGKDLTTEMLAAGMATPYDGGKRVNVWCPTK
jgi:micrococcal nuclease